LPSISQRFGAFHGYHPRTAEGERYMNQLAAEQLIMDLYENALGRRPGPKEFTNWVKKAVGAATPREDHPCIL